MRYYNPFWFVEEEKAVTAATSTKDQAKEEPRRMNSKEIEDENIDCLQWQNHLWSLSELSPPQMQSKPSKWLLQSPSDFSRPVSDPIQLHDISDEAQLNPLEINIPLLECYKCHINNLQQYPGTQYDQDELNNCFQHLLITSCSGDIYTDPLIPAKTSLEQAALAMPMDNAVVGAPLLAQSSDLTAPLERPYRTGQRFPAGQIQIGQEGKKSHIRLPPYGSLVAS